MKERKVDRYKFDDISVNIIHKCRETNAPRAVVFIDDYGLASVVSAACEMKKNKRKGKRKLGQRWKV